jgi:hypothetical protein
MERLDAKCRTPVSKQWACLPDGPQIVLRLTSWRSWTKSFDVVASLIMSLGRAAGISVWAATQNLRSRLSIRRYVRRSSPLSRSVCARSSESNIILGDGMASEGFDASKLSAPGECWVVGWGDGPKHVKAYDASVPPARKAEPVRVATNG